MKCRSRNKKIYSLPCYVKIHFYSFFFTRSKACKKELRQKIQFASTNQTSGESTHMAGASNSASSGAALSGANNNPPNIGGAVGGMNPGAQGGLGNSNNMHHPPPAL